MPDPGFISQGQSLTTCPLCHVFAPWPQPHSLMLTSRMVAAAWERALQSNTGMKPSHQLKPPTQPLPPSLDPARRLLLCSELRALVLHVVSQCATSIRPQLREDALVSVLNLAGEC